MTIRVWLDCEGDWGDMELHGEFVEANSLAELIPILQTELLFGQYTPEMSYDQLQEVLLENGYFMETM